MPIYASFDIIAEFFKKAFKCSSKTRRLFKMKKALLPYVEDLISDIRNRIEYIQQSQKICKTWALENIEGNDSVKDTFYIIRRQYPFISISITFVRHVFSRYINSDTWLDTHLFAKKINSRTLNRREDAMDDLLIWIISLMA